MVEMVCLLYTVVYYDKSHFCGFHVQIHSTENVHTWTQVFAVRLPVIFVNNNVFECY